MLLKGVVYTLPMHIQCEFRLTDFSVSSYQIHRHHTVIFVEKNLTQNVLRNIYESLAFAHGWIISFWWQDPCVSILYWLALQLDYVQWFLKDQTMDKIRIELFLIIHIGQFFGQYYLFIPFKYRHSLSSLDNFLNEVNIDALVYWFQWKLTSIFPLFLALLAKLIGVILWIVTFIDFYSNAPLGLRYFLCLFPNAGLLFCIQVMQQYERRSSTSIAFLKDKD